MSGPLYTPGQVQEVLARGAQLVEVLPQEEYGEQHLPGAVNIPLRQLDERAPAELERDRAVIVYCWDNACDLSPRAQKRLERLGFTDVYDYVPGKADWLAHGLPSEGTNASDPTAGSVADPDAPTCGLDDPVSSVRTPFCVVVDGDRVVHGVVRRSDLGEDDSRRAEEAMRKGPSTFRPNVPIGQLAEFMASHDLSFAPVTTSDGVLLGTITCEVAEAAAERDGANGRS
jgi:rhodanese-related sulfurtransferase